VTDSRPLEGVRVVDLGFWIAGPAAAGILADWGADVVKIEPPDGDPFRGVYLSGGAIEVPFNPPFELDNRGKRSIGLNLLEPEGRAVAHELLRNADVLVTNLRESALTRAGLDWDTLHDLNDRLVYCHVSGYGRSGPDKDRAAYDIGAYWARGGVAMSMVPPGSDPPQQRGGMGDHTTALGASGAICAALLARHRTGKGQLVTTSLLRTGLYVIGWDVNTRLRFGKSEAPYPRNDAPNPIINCYRCGDGRWLWLLGLQGDRHWPDLVAAVDRPDLLSDPRFANLRARRDNRRDCIAELDRIFASKPLSYWEEALDRCGMWWARVQDLVEVVEQDEQSRAAGAFVKTPTGDGEAEMLATPVDFGGAPPIPAAMTPEFGQHTEEILLELGYDWEKIAALRESGAIA
jgi:crotonobetainyl-CoA:carnitine CoA-transferase CaiB-like acyl-CoA transferase